MTSGLHSKLPQVVIAILTFAMASVPFDTACAEDKPGFFKKIFGGGEKPAPAATPPKTAAKPAPAAPPKTTPPAAPASSKPPRVIITTTGGGGQEEGRTEQAQHAQNGTHPGRDEVRG